MKNDNDNEIKFESLIVDKEDDFVKYNDALHKYWTKDTNQQCISVTTLIHSFAQPFDSEFWSKYKALEALLSKELFTPIKKILVDSKKFDYKYVIESGISEEDFENKVKEVLLEWEKKNKDACERGTALHKFHELQALGGNVESLQKLKLGGKFETKTDNKICPGKGVYPELLLSRISNDGVLKLAGQADLILIDGLDVYILDFKTNKSLDKKSYFDRKQKKSVKMQYPLNNLDDCNFSHYSLQLSTYAWMIQKINPEFVIKGLILIHLDHDGGETYHDCEYLKADVERMLSFHKKRIENEEFKKSREKIIF